MDMNIDFKEYQLRCELRGHEDDVRGICVCGNAGIATSSRDRTVRLWSLDPSDERRYAPAKILLGHTSFVGPLVWIESNEEYPEGRIVSGGMDTMVLVWDLKTGEKVQTLKGHQLQVTGIAFNNGDIVSSSVDNTLKRWRNGQLVESWEAHKAAIQAVIKLPSGELVTGSSDTTLKLWRGTTCTHTFVGHADTVRGLAMMSGLGVLSASHDGSIRLWALTGEVLMEMVGHTSIVYSVDSHVSGLIVSSSEDCFAKIWKDGVCVQSIEHPGCVWDAKFLENGDIVTACSDGVVRIWTVNQDKIADSLELESYFSQLTQHKISRKRVGGLKLEDLPGLEALQIPGTSDGQTKIVREGDNGVAYAWNVREQKWDKIGEVVDGPDDGMKRPVLDGSEYDYVFDVDIGDGEPIRKLPYNRSDNPYDTADKWLLKENLPLSYREQVVAFILQNTGQKDFTLDPTFRDPYTGASAYVPGQSSSKSGSAKPTFKHIPKKGMLVFDVAQFDGILKKITEFNNNLLSDQEKSNLSLNEVEVSRLGAIVKVLKDTSHYHSSKFAEGDIALLMRLLKSWPVAMLFPVIDTLRMIVLHPDGARLLLQHVRAENDLLWEMIKNVAINHSVPANLLTSVRVVTNLFKNSSFHNWLQLHRSEILDVYSSCYSSPNKNLQLSYATLILNYAVLLIDNKDREGQSQVLSAALQIAEEENLEIDAKFRALVAIGSLMLEGSVKQIAIDFDVENIAKIAKASKETKIAEVGVDIEVLTKQS
ncbi:putative transcription factor WD40-like family [Rosa chinensis]|uniref:Putative transcription factor WD40-like family n=1 Tax=Rosa chinensis TaxID=74649 RepID=A0A2P6PNP2_ROSCH|nr:phospholipase A-2-activating protein [Rosa chinensis]XP_024165001.1 phospholipase A-2-activating protein [Rosa chinensis]XP_024165002.1 phospholipase A-2-activating protein [Rosa chinensis]PRQ23545.1 putative transcription factor WD40-like family [Rosa chinensis]